MSRPTALARPDRVTSAQLLEQAHEWDAPGEGGQPAGEWVWRWEDIRAAARVATSRTTATRSQARETDLYDLALSGVALAVAEKPDIAWGDAIQAGLQDILDARRRALHARGTSLTGPMPRFAQFWLDWLRHAPAPHQCEERLTLAAVLDALPERHRATLIAFALTDTTEQAADLLGTSWSGFHQRLRKARHAALQLWFDHEPPPDMARLPIQRQKRGRTCRQGHVIDGDNIRREKARSGRIVERCRTCRLELDRARYARRRQEATP